MRSAAVRRQGNLLLCTLLLGNTVINSAISILLADLTTGAIGLVVATFCILIFGEAPGRVPAFLAAVLYSRRQVTEHCTQCR